ncbi:hypothetical protein GC207_06135 [bacterium]|nr:hypothetical protein [bacterium]
MDTLSIRKARLLRRFIPSICRFSLSCGLLGFGLLPADAATCIWTGTQNNLWSNSANWTNGITPDTGDSLVFPDGPKYRNLQNDRLDILSVSNIIFNGRGYTLGGNKIDLTGDIVSVPSLSTNRVLFPIDVYGPATFQNQGYFNQLELGGEIHLNSDPITLETISDIKISGTILGTNGVGTILHSNSNGKFELAENGRIYGDITLDRGVLLLSSTLSHGFIDGDRGMKLVIGNEVDSSKLAEVQFQARDKTTTNISVIINQSGFLNLVSAAHPEGVDETVGGVTGSGNINIGNGKLIIGNTLGDEFSGEIKGTGILQLGLPAPVTPPLPSVVKPAGALNVTGNPTFEGLVDVLSGYLTVRGSISNADLTLENDSHLEGNGIIKSLNTDAAVIMPGPGTLRILNSCTLDYWTVLWTHLDGPNKGMLRAATLNLNSAYLGIIYEGGDADTSYTIATADYDLSSNFRWDKVSLPEGAWVVSGDPSSEFQITYATNGGHDAVLNRFGLYIAPTLSIRHLSESESVISWPLAAHDFRLQRTFPNDLGGWTTNDLPTIEANTTEHFVVETNSRPWRFYRLIR